MNGNIQLLWLQINQWIVEIFSNLCKNNIKWNVFEFIFTINDISIEKDKLIDENERIGKEHNWLLVFLLL
jgi:hypothetical protein